MSFFAPVITSSGSKTAKLMFVGEAPGETEELLGLPFVGSSGQELGLMMKEVGIDREDCYFTNVFFSRPESNKILNFMVSKKETVGNLPPMQQGKYIHPSLLPEIDRLKGELEEVRPNLVVALGNTAVWAICQQSGITRLRGAITECALVPGLKVLPTFHPSNVMRQYENRPIMLQDMAKAKREMQFPEIRRPQRMVTIDPTIEETEAFVAEALAAPRIAIDIETKNKQITMIGFAISPSRGFVVPFVDETKPGFNYWPTHELEVRALAACRKILLGPGKKLFQNGLYDIQYLWRYGIPTTVDDDTMLLHHSLYPELPKGLDFLGSVYTNEAAWKLVRKRGGDEMNKRDE